MALLTKTASLGPDVGRVAVVLQPVWNRRVPSSRRSRERIGRTTNAVSTCSFNVPTSTNLLPSVITSVVHDRTAPVAQYLGAIDIGDGP